MTSLQVPHCVCSFMLTGKHEQDCPLATVRDPYPAEVKCRLCKHEIGDFKGCEHDCHKPVEGPHCAFCKPGGHYEMRKCKDCPCHSPLSARQLAGKKIAAILFGIVEPERINRVIEALDTYTLSLSKELVEKIEACKWEESAYRKNHVISDNARTTQTNISRRAHNNSKDEDIKIIKDTLQVKKDV